ncbi:hypothetical protein EIP86_011520 [Pleurotus ostreatoroseus]|nr:hypothetical protein EIP86_011520 [Pleurotus ostreatoroseus]
MSLNAHDNIVLVAPRPVRLAAPVPYPPLHSAIVSRPQPIRPAATFRFVASPSEAFEKLKLSDDVSDDERKLDFSERDRLSASPRASHSPRSALPSEALEEFLSILRPSTTFLFPPTSPILRPSNALTHGFVAYRRPQSCRLSPSLAGDNLSVAVEQIDNDAKENELPYSFTLLGKQHLASPVSRTQTRNPFPPPSEQQNAVSAFITEHTGTPSPTSAHSPSAALSPAAVPLPLPTPDEMDLESTS